MTGINGMMHHTGVIDTLPLGKHSIQYVEHQWNDAPHRSHDHTAVGQAFNPVRSVYMEHSQNDGPHFTRLITCRRWACIQSVVASSLAVGHRMIMIICSIKYRFNSMK